MKKSLLLLVFVLMMALVATGCGGTGATEEAAGDLEVLTAEEDEFNERGHKAVIEITRENGQIVAVDYNEIYEEGGNKKEDAEYNENMEAVSGTSFEDGVAALEAALIESQDPDAVDVVSGATSSSDKFVELAKEALQ